VNYNETKNPDLEAKNAQKRIKTEEYACQYEGKNKLGNPLWIRCRLGGKFLTGKNFKPVFRIKNAYIILENKNKPIIKK